MTKRLFDIAASMGGLIILGPLMLALAMLVKFSDGGSVFFRQVRVGLGGKPFAILKFRSMRESPSAAGPEVTTAHDTRITPVGRFLRNTKLDELPQLINVLRGEMSIVGPRPEVPRYVAKYAESDRKLLLSVRPGMTDLAAIEMRDEERILAQFDDVEAGYVEHIMPRKMQLYRQYIENSSMALDIAIIFRTLVAILKR